MDNKEIKVKRGNVILKVPEYQKQEYLAKGFNVIGEDGKIKEACVPNDIGSLKKAYFEHVAKIEELEKKLASKSKPKTTAKATEDATPKKRTTKAKAE